MIMVMGGRGLRLDSLQPTPGRTDGPSAEVHREAAIARLSEAVRIPTVSFVDVDQTDSASFRQLHGLFEAAYPRVHATLEKEVVGGLSLLYTWQGTDPSLEPILLMGHQDVVPVMPGTERDWTHPPFAGVSDGEYVWGRGTIDDKGAVVAILEAVEALLDAGYQPRRTVYLAFGHDEEVGGMHGAGEISRVLEVRGAEPYAFVLDEGGAVTRGMMPGLAGALAMVGIAEKGSVDLELSVEGAGGHSSSPPASTSIGILAEAISAIEGNPFPARFSGATEKMFEYVAPEMGLPARILFANLWAFEPVIIRALVRDPATAALVRTTTAVTIVEGGVRANQLPTGARAIANHRIVPGETPETVMERVRSVIDDDRVRVRVYGEGTRSPSPVSDPDGDAFRLLARTIRQVMGDEVVVAPYLVIGGTDAKHYSGRSPGVFRFVPVLMEADALQRMHGTDERIPIESYLLSIAFFQQIIRNADGL
jgi:carboxypeptidase PM20D1